MPTRDNLASCTIIVILWALAVQAEEVPGTIIYQGYLTAAGEPTNGQKPVIVRLFVGEEQICEESHIAGNSISFVSGHFSVEIGRTACASLRGRFASASNIFLELTIDNGRLQPRIPLRSVPYAMQSQHAEAAEALSGGLTGDEIMTQLEEFQRKLSCIETCQPVESCGDKHCFSGGQAGRCFEGTCSQICKGSWCPRLEGYAINCNTQQHCEYTPLNPTGWQAYNVWIWVPPGRFQMGAPIEELNSRESERPVHEVNFENGFFIAKYELTEAIYQACEMAGACVERPQSGANSSRPQADINFDESQAACAWLGGRLPSEAEWEYSASGPIHRIYPWGDIEASCDLAVMDDGRGVSCGHNLRFNVGSKPKGVSYVGAMDMAGNVYERVEDCIHYSYDNAPSNGRAWMQDCEDEYLGMRGGSDGYDAERMRSSSRNNTLPSTRHLQFGVRCFMDHP